VSVALGGGLGEAWILMNELFVEVLEQVAEEGVGAVRVEIEVQGRLGIDDGGDDVAVADKGPRRGDDRLDALKSVEPRQWQVIADVGVVRVGLGVVLGEDA
jgi:hypothetical protein